MTLEFKVLVYTGFKVRPRSRSSRYTPPLRPRSRSQEEKGHKTPQTFVLTRAVRSQALLRDLTILDRNAVSFMKFNEAQDLLELGCDDRILTIWNRANELGQWLADVHTNFTGPFSSPVFSFVVPGPVVSSSANGLDCLSRNVVENTGLSILTPPKKGSKVPREGLG